MPETSPLRIALIGCGKIARKHIGYFGTKSVDARIVALCDPSFAAYQGVAELFLQVGVEPPPYVPDLQTLVTEFRNRADIVLVGTPHVYHYEQAAACLEGGFDVLLEKPMVMNVAEAERLIEVRNRTGKLLVVSFDGGMSPRIRAASQMLRSGVCGKMVAISATVWEDWAQKYAGHWKQAPEISGGGFLFDTGAHMLNTVAELAGDEIVEVAAWMSDRSRPVDIAAAVIARLKSGVLITMNACGETIPSCSSDIRVFCTEAILYAEAWGRRLEIQRNGVEAPVPVDVPQSRGPLEVFLAVRRGEIENPCPPEVGLRMARLWEAIQRSAAAGGAPVATGSR